MWSDWINAVAEWFLSYGSWGLAILSFFESSFFPVIPDVILIPLGIAQPELVWWYALITTLSSVAGALLGWWIGKKLGRPLMLRFFKQETVEKVEAYFEKYGGFSLAIAGFTPIPFKVFTIASGMCKIRIREVIIWSLLGRGARFFLEALIIAWLGKAAGEFINQYFGPLTLSLVALVLLAALIWHLLRRKRAAN
ncbi:YqaA family protein [Kroppenstedtia eburnea]|uniref:Undecaprenyl-diphosphatase n=1 Tax=Kroppenstedtia eburnea TaxID=714067 RepID=A0A1N7PT51_9BACL|nr:YqaA family protein [Kroppenstedtia eburnea]EGK12791.1 DedA family protein [Desmospora sp. 8437]QKI82669.1 DedA family protein [Kroppenstedtia eburnea]SIT13746.1 undecaprenyl-diphosphatase [Kroppenstedtia eburnea]